MPQLIIDFSAYPDGPAVAGGGGDFSAITGWTPQIVTDVASFTGKKLVMQDPGGTGDAFTALLDELIGAQTGDIEVAALVSVANPAAAAASAIVGPCLVAADGQSYGLRIGTLTLMRGCIFSASGQANNFIGADIPVATITSTRFWLLVGRAGTTIYFNVWPFAGQRPGSPQASGVHSALTSVKAGVGCRTSAAGPYSVELLVVGTEGDPAPVPGSAPSITDAGDELFNPGETGVVVTGSTFGAPQGSGAVYLSPTDDVNDVARVAQTITGWNDTSIVFTCTAGTLPRDTDLYLFVVNDDGQSNAAGYLVQIAATGPNILDAGDESFTDGEAGVVLTGSQFGAVQGAGAVYLSPTNDVNDVGRVAQTVTAWADDSITLTIVKGTLPFLTQLYLFVVADDAESNPQGFAVQIEPRVFVQDAVVDLGGNPVALNGDMLLIWLQAPTLGSPNPDEVIVLGSIPDGQINTEIQRGSLAPGDPVLAQLVGPGVGRASAKWLMPTYQ